MIVSMFMQGKDKTPEERRIAICIFDDVAEQCRETALKYGFLLIYLSVFLNLIYHHSHRLFNLNRYYDTYLPFLLEACNDENPDVRQVCLVSIWTSFLK